MNSRLSFRTSPRVAGALLALVAVAALSPVVACGGSDDDDSGAGGTTDGGSGGTGDDSSTTTGIDSGAKDATSDAAGDATTADSSTSGEDAAADSSTDATDAGLADSAAPDAASGDCTPVNGYFDLKGPGSGSGSFCPTESGITCHFATESGSCELVTQCQSDDGGLGTGFFAIPTGTLDATDSLTYSTTYPVPGTGGAFDFVASCTLHFSSTQSTATLTCSGSAPIVGTLTSCDYSGGRTDGGL